MKLPKRLDSWASAGDDGKTPLDELAGEALGGLVLRGVRAEPCRAEDTDGLADLAHRLETVDELRHDSEHAPCFMRRIAVESMIRGHGFPRAVTRACGRARAAGS